MTSTTRGTVRTLSTVIAVTGSLALAACGGSSSSSSTTTTASTATAAASATDTSTASGMTSATTSPTATDTSAAASGASTSAAAVPSTSQTPATSASASGSASAAQKAGTYTMTQVATHKTRTSCWTVINGNVYNLTAWVSKHPGGASKILAICGKNGTAAFEAQHGRGTRAKTVLATYKIGTLAK